MSIREFFVTVFRSWRLVFLMTFGFTLFAFGASFCFTPQWESEANIVIGTIGGKAIESNSELFSRIRSTNVIKHVLMDINQEVTQRNIIKLRSDTRLFLQGDIVEVKVRAKSLELAKKILSSYFDEVVKEHVEITGPQFKALSEKIDKLNKENEQINQLLNTNSIEKFNSASYNEKAAVLEMISKTKVQQHAIEDQLSVLQSKPTYLQNPIDAMPDPVSPNRFLMTLLGAVLGFSFSIIYLFSSDKKAT